MNLPKYPQLGHPVRAEWARAVIDYLRSLTPRSSATVATQHLPGGVTYSVKPGRGRGISQPRPFELFDATEDGVTKVRVLASTVADVMPEEFQSGESYKFEVTADGYFWAFVTIDTAADAGEIIDSGIGNGAAVPENTEDTYYVPIGSYSPSEDAVAVNNFRYGPVIVDVCRQWFANPPVWNVVFF